ncbi:Protein of unknown function [Gryllus bimaculatus]|nr:Protein of unknown function [Gryllus bimaculatus]
MSQLDVEHAVEQIVGNTDDDDDDDDDDDEMQWNGMRGFTRERIPTKPDGYFQGGLPWKETLWSHLDLPGWPLRDKRRAVAAEQWASKLFSRPAATGTRKRRATPSRGLV